MEVIQTRGRFSSEQERVGVLNVYQTAIDEIRRHLKRSEHSTR